MTREEAIFILKRDNPNNIAIRSGFESLYDQRKEAFSMAIKALEQEPVLDKIRAEIENMQIVYDKSANYKDERTDEEKANDLGKMYKVLVLSIIDKYKAESEVENGSN